MNSEEKRYQICQDKKQQDWESLCNGCGACCGASENDPCEHLIQLDNGRYWCTIYNDRLGMHKTRSGIEFRCVPIQQILHHISWAGDSECVYKKSGKLSP